jgi:hypothetical protein
MTDKRCGTCKWLKELDPVLDRIQTSHGLCERIPKFDPVARPKDSDMIAILSYDRIYPLCHPEFGCRLWEGKEDSHD